MLKRYASVVWPTPRTLYTPHTCALVTLANIRMAKPKQPTAAPKAKAAAPRAAANDEERTLWAPKMETVVSLLLVPRVISALVNPIADCDESFNYWEPLHFMLHGFGFQTWEYSPVYALRSYFYLAFHALIAKATELGLVLAGGSGAVVSKVVVFYGVRGALGLLCAYAEALFYQSCVARFGRRTGRYLLWILLWNAGMFHASTALLPSVFVMYLIMLFTSAWMNQQHFVAMLWGVIAVLCGWPYVGVLFLPFALETLYQRGVLKSLAMGVLIGGSVLALEIGVNFHYYQRIVLPAWNIVYYNVLSGETDSTLYVTEPWSYYVMNLVLNFNVLALVAAPGALFLALLRTPAGSSSKLQLLAYLSPLYIWMTIMFAQAHKEERFLFPVYPLLCLAAAITLSASVHTLQRLPKIGRLLSTLMVYGVLIVYTLLSVSRITSNVINFTAPLRVYHHLHEHVLPNPATSVLSNSATTLCIHKEWYRFPASFFVPSNHTRVEFLKSSFGGILPKAFEQHENGTSIIPSAMNDKNQEEPSRYVPLSACDYVVDLKLPTHEEPWEDTTTWEVVHTEAFLDAERSRSPYRSFYIPFVTEKHVRFAKYSIYKRKKAD